MTVINRESLKHSLLISTEDRFQVAEIHQGVLVLETQGKGF